MKAWLTGALAAACATAAEAGAWPMREGEGQLITRYERQTANEEFDGDGDGRPIPARWDESAVAFVEYGLSDRITLQGKLGLVRGQDVATGYQGATPAELGLRWAAWRRGRTVVSVYGGALSPGYGENAVYVSRKRSDGELEARVMFGRSGVWRRRPAFVDVQVARMWRAGAPDEVRWDSTVGIEATPNWLILAQTYSGETDGAQDGLRPGWVNAEVSAVRRMPGGWRAQLGYRTAVSGRETTVGSGPVVAIWRSF